MAPPGVEDWREQAKRHDRMVILVHPYITGDDGAQTINGMGMELEGVGTAFPSGGKPVLRGLGGLEESVKNTIVGTPETLEQLSQQEHRWDRLRDKRQTFS